MFRTIILCLLAACAAGPVFSAGIGSPVTGSFNTDNWHTVRVDVDYGATPQAITAGVDVTSLSGPTFLFEWIDWDGYVAGLSNVSTTQQVMPGSNNTGQVTTPARTGVHPFVLRLDNTLDPGKLVDFAFTVSLGSATLVSYAQSDRPYVAAGYPLRATEGDLAATFLSFGESKNLGTLVTLDFGSTPQAADVRLDCSAEGIRDIVLRWPDGMGNYAALFVDADANGNLYSVPGVNHLATIPAQSGLVTVTVSVSAEADFNYADWTLNLPGSVKVVETHAPTGGGSHGAGREGQGCSTSPDGRLPLVLAAAAGAALTWRRRRKPI